MVVEEQLGRHVMGMAQYIGGRFPAHTTSTGHVLLAFGDEAIRNRLDLLRMLSSHPTSITNRIQFMDELEAVRSRGYAKTQDALEVGLSAVAAPIFNTHNEIQGALCIAAPSSRMTAKRVDELVDTIINSAQTISQNLGYNPIVNPKL